MPHQRHSRPQRSVPCPQGQRSNHRTEFWAVCR
jgi:hypothetical protein